jgi:hypothetical protein
MKSATDLYLRSVARSCIAEMHSGFMNLYFKEWRDEATKETSIIDFVDVA